jgi:hypothetical protein
LKGLEQFLLIFGDITVSQIVIWVMAFVFVYLIYKEIKKYIDAAVKAKHAEIEEKQNYKKKIDDAYIVTQKYPAYHQESIQIRDSLKSEINEIRDRFGAIMDRLDDIEEQNMKRECSRLRDVLLQNYRYYANESKNPSKSWTIMESEAFWELFREYEAAGGNGYMHTVVQPEMERLTVVDVGHRPGM